METERFVCLTRNKHKISGNFKESELKKFLNAGWIEVSYLEAIENKDESFIRAFKKELEKGEIIRII